MKGGTALTGISPNAAGRRRKDALTKGLVIFSAALLVALLAAIIGFILYKGLPGISVHFLTASYENETTYVTTGFYADLQDTGEEGYIANLDVSLAYDEEANAVVFADIGNGSPVKAAVDAQGNTYAVKEGDELLTAGDLNVETALADGEAPAEVIANVKAAMESVTAGGMTLKIVRPGGGILPMLVTTLYLVGLSLLIAVPIGICAAIYLHEYAKKGKLVRVILFCVETLSGIPSIIYGLFGALFFVQMLHMQYSVLAGACTVSIMLLPIIIATTREALAAIPDAYRMSSLGLGATKLYTIRKIVLPNALSGILVAVLLSIGRIVGESAALLLTAGTVAQIPEKLTGSGAAGATLTIKAYTLMKEENDLTGACAIGVVLLAVVILINLAAHAAEGRLKRREKRREKQHG